VAVCPPVVRVVSAEIEEQRSSRLAKLAAIAALAIALAATAWVLLRDDPYTVKARFQAISTLVDGNVVKVAGRRAGTVKSVALAPNGEAEVEFEVDEPFRPLRQGTLAKLRIQSLSGSTSRYIELRIPEGDAPAIPEGGLIPADRTSSEVDIDQLFALFDEDTRKGLTKLIRGFGRQYEGRSAEANLGWRYLNPSFVASRRLFRELERDRPALEAFIVNVSRLVTDVADRRDDLVDLVDGVADTMGALAREEVALSETISELPPFLRRANTTFVNLRATLDDVDPLLDESAEVTPRLRATLAALRGLSSDIRPTVRDLVRTIRRPGADNDLIDLQRRAPQVRDQLVGPVVRNGRERPGTLPQGTTSLRGQTPHLAFFRPYMVDFTGWLDDFSHSGIYDANGSASRVATSVNLFAALGGQLRPVPPQLWQFIRDGTAVTGQNNRCPGSMERGSLWKPDHVNCDPTQVPPGR
jgi:phospholipid/cholesterol/gamma-HCH transport system substrate-binding protein